MEINAKIRAYIDERGLKQTRIAARAHITSQKFSAMMTSRRRISAEEFGRICLALEADPRIFLPASPR